MRNALHALTAMLLRTLRPALSPCRSANSSPCSSATAKSDALMASAESSISSIAVVDLVVLVELELEAEVELEEEVELLEIDPGLESLRECSECTGAPQHTSSLWCMITARATYRMRHTLLL